MTEPARQLPKARLRELDGFRALAILAVTAYHYFQRFPLLYPYGDGILRSARWGYLGVEFFFMISGFVIVMTLETTERWQDFALKRAARLVPPIIVASLLTAAVVSTLGQALPETMQPHWPDFLPSWTMTDPKFWHWLAPEAKYVDGAYWSLYAEVRFYLWATLAYFLLPRVPIQVVLIGLVVAGQVLTHAPVQAFEIPRGALARHLLISDYLPFFAFGAFAFALWRGKSGLYWAGAAAMLGVGLICLPDHVARGALLAMAVAFWLLIRLPILLRPLLFALPQFYGKISYSFYLLHQMIGLTLISNLPPDWAWPWQLLGVAAIFLLVTAAAWGLFLAVESRSGRLARALLR